MKRSPWSDRNEQPSASAEVIAAIEGSQLLIERFGGWPGFADFEVISLHFERGNFMQVSETKQWSEFIEPSLSVVLYGFDLRYSHDDANRKPTLITMRFEGSFERFALDGFNHQNPIVGLEIIFEGSANLDRSLFAVDWGGTGVHHEASFTCARVIVSDVRALAASSG